MAYSYVYYWGDNLSGPWPVPFSYISKDDIEVFVDDEPATFTWHTDTDILTDSPVPTQSRLKIQRRTQRDHRYVDFTDASILSEEELDLDSLQAFFLIQELLDGTLTSDGSGSPISIGDDPDGSGNLDQGDIDYILDSLQGRIRDTHLYQTLKSRIDLIDVSPINLKDRLDALDNAIDGEVTLLKEDATALQTSVTDLEEAMYSADGVVGAIEQDIQFWDGELASVRNSITLVEGTVNELSAVPWEATGAYVLGDKVSYNGKIYEVYHLPDGHDSVTNATPPEYPHIWRELADVSGAVDQLTQKVAQAQQDASAAINEIGSLEAQIQDRVTVGEFGTFQETAVVQSDLSVYITEGELQAELQNIAQVQVEDRVAAVEETLWAGTVGDGTAESPANDSLLAQYVLKLDVNGAVAGFGVSLDEDQNSHFIINAEHFAVTHTSVGGQEVIPFIVSTDDYGQPIVGIDGAVIIDGTLTASAINALETVSVGDLDNDVLARIFDSSMKRTSELTDDGGLGQKADWSQVSNDNGGRPENNANRVNFDLSTGELYTNGWRVEANNQTLRNWITSQNYVGSDEVAQELQDQLGGMNPTLVGQWASDPGARMNELVYGGGTKITGGVIATGAIRAEHIGVESLAALHATLGTVSAGRIEFPSGVAIGMLSWYDDGQHGQYLQGSHGIWFGKGSGFYRTQYGAVVFSVNAGQGGNSLTFNSGNGELVLNGRIINKNNVENDAGLNDRQLGAVSGTAYVVGKKKIYHGLSRPPVVSISRELNDGNEPSAFVGTINNSYFEIVTTWAGVQYINYTYL